MCITFLFIDEPLGGASPTVSDSDSGAETKAEKIPKKRKLSKSSSKKSKKKVKKSKVVQDSEDEDEKVGWLIGA